MKERERERERERESCLLACSPIDAPETAVLIAICSMDIHQYDPSNFLVASCPKWPSKLAKHVRTGYHIEVP